MNDNEKARKRSEQERHEGIDQSDAAADWLREQEIVTEVTRQAEEARTKRHSLLWRKVDEPEAVRLLREARERRMGQ